MSKNTYFWVHFRILGRYSAREFWVFVQSLNCLKVGVRTNECTCRTAVGWQVHSNDDVLLFGCLNFVQTSSNVFFFSRFIHHFHDFFVYLWSYFSHAYVVYIFNSCVILVDPFEAYTTSMWRMTVYRLELFKVRTIQDCKI